MVLTNMSGLNLFLIRSQYGGDLISHSAVRISLRRRVSRTTR